MCTAATTAGLNRVKDGSPCSFAVEFATNADGFVCTSKECKGISSETALSWEVSMTIAVFNNDFLSVSATMSEVGPDPTSDASILSTSVSDEGIEAGGADVTAELDPEEDRPFSAELSFTSASDLGNVMVLFLGAMTLALAAVVPAGTEVVDGCLVNDTICVFDCGAANDLLDNVLNFVNDSRFSPFLPRIAGLRGFTDGKCGL
jgi:hypothetical protein